MPSAHPDPRLAALLGPLALAAAQRDEDGLAVKDAARGTWLYADERLAQWLQRPAEALVGASDADLFGEAASALRMADQAAASAPAATVSEHRLELQGARREFSVLRLRLDRPDGEPLLALWWRDLGPQRRREAQLRNALEQLEQQQQANEQLRREVQGQSPRDGATGLYNRAHFDDQLRREVDLSTREHREFALVAIELDPLPAETAALGETARERVNQAIGRLLRGNTRAMDASCRCDEHRFAVLLSGVGLATAHSRMEGLRRQCATQIVAYEGREIGFTVSMGVASFPHTAQTHEQLSAACDAALADARERGGNRVTLASIRFESA
jgi:diguanylate cyclase (GGDEF)-like protein